MSSETEVDRGRSQSGNRLVNVCPERLLLERHQINQPLSYIFISPIATHNYLIPVLKLLSDIKFYEFLNEVIIIIHFLIVFFKLIFSFFFYFYF